MDLREFAQVKVEMTKEAMNPIEVGMKARGAFGPVVRNVGRKVVSAAVAKDLRTAISGIRNLKAQGFSLPEIFNMVRKGEAPGGKGIGSYAEKYKLPEHAQGLARQGAKGLAHSGALYGGAAAAGGAAYGAKKAFGKKN